MSSRRSLSGKTTLVGNENRFSRSNCEQKTARPVIYRGVFGYGMWVGCVVSSVSCRASLHLSGMKDDFVWAGSAGKRTSCDFLFIVVECSELHCT